MSVIDAVKKFLLDLKYIKPGQVIDESESLLEHGIIDSVAVVKLVVFLQNTYGIEIEEDDLMPENFDSLAAINDYVKNKKS